jgi:hypothetical protein
MWTACEYLMLMCICWCFWFLKEERFWAYFHYAWKFLDKCGQYKSWFFCKRSSWSLIHLYSYMLGCLQTFLNSFLYSVLDHHVSRIAVRYQGCKSTRRISKFLINTKEITECPLKPTSCTIHMGFWSPHDVVRTHNQAYLGNVPGNTTQIIPFLILRIINIVTSMLLQ